MSVNYYLEHYGIPIILNISRYIDLKTFMNLVNTTRKIRNLINIRHIQILYYESQSISFNKAGFTIDKSNRKVFNEIVIINDQFKFQTENMILIDLTNDLVNKITFRNSQKSFYVSFQLGYYSTVSINSLMSDPIIHICLSEPVLAYIATGIKVSRNRYNYLISEDNRNISSLMLLFYDLCKNFPYMNGLVNWFKIRTYGDLERMKQCINMLKKMFIGNYEPNKIMVLNNI